MNPSTINPGWHLNCPRCGLSIEVKPDRAAIRHCPRCIGRSRVVVALFNSTLPTDLLYDAGSSPSAGEEQALASETAMSAGGAVPATARRAA